jgi:hypothetical protein
MSLAPRLAFALLAAWLVPLATAAAAPYEYPAGRLALDVGLGGGQAGAPFLILGAAIGIVDNPSRRVDLRARFGILQTQETGPGMDGDELTYNGSAFIVDVAHAWRMGRLEPWVSIGYATLHASLDDPASATGPTRTDRASALAVGAGLRLPIGPHALLAVEGLLTTRTDSKMTWLSPTPGIGGGSVLGSITWRLGSEVTHSEPTVTLPRWPTPESEVGAPPATEVEPSEPRPVPPAPAAPAEPATPAIAPPSIAPPSIAPPAPPPAGEPLTCLISPEVPSFATHPQRTYLCRENPVAGGFFCTLRTVEERWIDRTACERGCRRGGSECPAVRSTTGAACARCEAECGELQWRPCNAASGATLDGSACRVEAGRWGVTEPVTVPAECRTPAAGE